MPDLGAARAVIAGLVVGVAAGAGRGGTFCQQGGSLTITGGSLSGGVVSGGAAGANDLAGGAGGAAYGAGVFVQGDQTITFQTAPGQVTTVADGIADMSGSTIRPGRVGLVGCWWWAGGFGAERRQQLFGRDSGERQRTTLLIASDAALGMAGC